MRAGVRSDIQCAGTPTVISLPVRVFTAQRSARRPPGGPGVKRNRGSALDAGWRVRM